MDYLAHFIEVNELNLEVIEYRFQVSFPSCLILALTQITAVVLLLLGS